MLLASTTELEKRSAKAASVLSTKVRWRFWAFSCSLPTTQHTPRNAYSASLGTNLLNNQPVAIKFEPRKSDAPQLRDEYRTYKIMAGSSNYPILQRIMGEGNIVRQRRNVDVFFLFFFLMYSGNTHGLLLWSGGPPQYPCDWLAGPQSWRYVRYLRPTILH